jgi:hypothetical protein
MGKGEGSRAEAEENDLSGGAEENRRGAAGKVGEGEKGGIREPEPGVIIDVWQEKQ